MERYRQIAIDMPDAAGLNLRSYGFDGETEDIAAWLRDVGSSDSGIANDLRTMQAVGNGGGYDTGAIGDGFGSSGLDANELSIGVGGDGYGDPLGQPGYSERSEENPWGRPLSADPFTTGSEPTPSAEASSGSTPEATADDTGPDDSDEGSIEAGA
jgi:hypothetical protein